MNSSPRLRVSHFGPAASPALDARLTAPAASGLCRPLGATFGSLPRPSPRAWFSTLDPTASVYSLNTCAAPFSRKRAAFSLIEVVLAIGVVAFALVGIFGLFSASLKTNKDSSAQQEGFEVARMISSRLQDTNFLTPDALASLQSTLAGGTPSSYYIYTSSNALVLTNSATGYGLTNGLLYYVQMSKSPNIDSMTNVFPVDSDWKNWPGLPVHVMVYTIPSPTQTNAIANTPPVMTFDMVIPR